MTYEELMNLLPSDVLNTDIWVVEYAMAPYWNKRTVSYKPSILRGFFQPDDVIYSAKRFND